MFGPRRSERLRTTTTIKRKAEVSPIKKGGKRAVLGDISNKNNIKQQQQGVLNYGNLKKKKASDVIKKGSAESESSSFEEDKKNLMKEEEVIEKKEVDEIEILESELSLPDGVIDYDKECGDDPYQVGLYAKDIFNYYRERETQFPVKKYLDSQEELNKNMRSILVDWLVEVQESFELNHETLYLAVKLVDLFLGKVQIKRDKLQLVGTTAFWIASKFDERTAPSIDDFCYICDDAYPMGAILKMEVTMLKTLNYDIGIPLSYRFLRRYARCAKLDMETLTLSRYILESSLMEYDLIDVRDSMMAGAALLLALTINKIDKPWTPTLVYYSGFKLDDLYDLANRMLSALRNPPQQVKTIKAKYSHTIFYSVAKIPLPDEIKPEGSE